MYKAYALAKDAQDRDITISVSQNYEGYFIPESPEYGMGQKYRSVYSAVNMYSFRHGLKLESNIERI